MKTKYFFFLGLLAALFVFVTCGKRNDILWVYYDETNCADRWQPNHNNELLKDNLKEYYDTKGVHIYDVEIFLDRTPEGCPDCLCKTGRRFKAKIKGKDLKALKADGFYEQ